MRLTERLAATLAALAFTATTLLTTVTIPAAANDRIAVAAIPVLA